MKKQAGNHILLRKSMVIWLLPWTIPSIASATFTPGSPPLQQVIDRVKSNEDKLSLIKMNFSADFTSEGEPPDYPRDPRASGGRYKVMHEEIQWAQDGIRQRFTHRTFGDGSLCLSQICVVDGEVKKSADWPDLKRGSIAGVSAYSRWMVNYASQLYYRPVCRGPADWPLLSRVLASSALMSDVIRQRIGDRDVFVLDIKSGTVGCRRLYIDTERGLLLRSEIYSRPPDAEQARVVERIELTKVHQTDNGGWIALEGRKVNYGEGYTRSMDVHVDPNSVSVDRADIPDSLFQLDFPEHSIVTNTLLAVTSRGKADAIATKSLADLYAGTKTTDPNAHSPAQTEAQESNDWSATAEAESEQEPPEQGSTDDASPGNASHGWTGAWIVRQFGLLTLVAGATLLVLALRGRRKA